MNKPCKIHFHEDTAPLYGQLPTSHHAYVCDPDVEFDEPVLALYSQSAFYVDFSNGGLLRTRVRGNKEDDPLDFPMTSIAFIEWYYGNVVPAPLTPHLPEARTRPPAATPYTNGRRN